MDRKGISQRHYMFKEGVDTSPIKVLRPSGFLSDVSEQTKRKPIFGRSSSSTNVTSNYFPGNWCGSICEQRSTEAIFSDESCGCENESGPCKHIKTVLYACSSMSSMQKEFQIIEEQYPKQGLGRSRQELIAALPSYYPSAYVAQLQKLMKMCSGDSMPASSFVLLAWMHYHAKLDYVTYFLYQELEEQFISYQSFLNQLNSALSGHDQSCYNKFHLIDFVEDYYNSKGALLVPLCQYAKFLLLLKTNTAKMFTALLKLFYISKQDIMKQVLTYYTNLETIKLREYLRQLPWNKLFEEAQSI